MPRRKDSPPLLELAKRGVQVQLSDLVHEVKMLFDLFPHLRDSVDPDELPLLFILKQGAQKARRKRTLKASRKASKPPKSPKKS